ncbi:hypothetical protein MUN81_04355 [Hymenobacter sp. 5317J-9]|uniref:hypothetical protein n=1 Tax=Hymenobacter sp. 5317J-9 TaxID=2932250 RepID=UPI001FD71862|nr:hypothetical protein [Hymenobacter sp. 5317J-9]UOQ98726.1 hypothetical protein MUN81_04355 [Hymenobacter sp. 5317J-9]
MPLIEVVDDRLARLFIELPARLHAGVPNYIGPLENEVEAVFDPAKNPKFKNGECARWVLTDASGQTMGRVAAFLNRDAVDVQNAELPTGGMGFFECIDDQAAANQLFEAARLWLAARGMQAMDGPINFGERDRFWGLLIDGYDLEPNYGMFWHPAYYRPLFEQYGFELYFKQYTCYRTTAAELHPSFAKRAEEHAGTYRFAHARKQEAEKLAQDFHHVYNLAWARHSGVKPMTLDEARKIVQQMKPVLDERLLWFAYHGEEPVAFFISLPELNQIFKHVGRRLNLLGKLRFLWEQRRYMQRRDKKLFGIIYGVVPEHQGKGVDAAMLVYARQAFIDAGYADIEMNWIGDFNPRMLVTTRSIGAKILKTHATYRYLFDRERPFERMPIIR